jgi:GlpG protein
LQAFARDPQASVFRKAADEAAKRRKATADAEKAAAKRTFDVIDLFSKKLLWGMGRLTAALVLISVAIWLAMLFSNDTTLLKLLLIDPHDIGISPSNRWRHGLEAIKHGQIWRLITPIFIHDLRMFLHILFNMLWLRDLGTMIEVRLGWKYLLAQVLVIGSLSNLAQYFISGPAFGGMSGVVYGLLGYIWMKSKFDPGSGFFLHEVTVVMMLIWLGFGFTNLLSIANTVHTVGLLTRVVWGLISAFAKR